MEMLRLVKQLPATAYRPRTYVVSETDRLSASKATALEASLVVVDKHSRSDGDSIGSSSRADSESTNENGSGDDGASGGEHSSSLRQQQSFAYDICHIPRSREVGQGVLSTILASTRALLFCIPLVLFRRPLPDVVLCNGPGTCVPICLLTYLPRLLGLKRIRLVYIESICRVDSLSLSGKLLYPFVDHMLVQWPQLRKNYPRAQYIGRLT